MVIVTLHFTCETWTLYGRYIKKPGKDTHGGPSLYTWLKLHKHRNFDQHQINAHLGTNLLYMSSAYSNIAFLVCSSRKYQKRMIRPKDKVVSTFDRFRWRSIRHKKYYGVKKNYHWNRTTRLCKFSVSQNFLLLAASDYVRPDLVCGDTSGFMDTMQDSKGI